MSRSLGDRSLTTRSPMYIFPDEIPSNPATIRNAVDFPHPDGPTRITNSSSAISRLRSKIAWVPSG
jgi:hypothetical protein